MERRTILIAVVSLVLSVQLCMCNSNQTQTTLASSNDIKSSVTDYAETTTPPMPTKQKPFYSTGNELWDSLIQDCLKKPSFSCIQKNVYNYLDTTLSLNDVNVTNRIQLTRNQFEYEMPQSPENDEENEIGFEGRAAPIEEVSSALYEKSVKFLVTHNYEVQLPEIMFDGARFRLQPRSIEGNGIIAKLEYIPKSEIEEGRGTGIEDARLFFKKKIKKFFKKKSVLAILAVILIIKVIKIKMFWLLPLLVGAGTAKKLVLKFLLFLFPALSHIFKLCGYYHANHHKTNYHHHKHHINHLHTVLVDGEHHTGPSGHGDDHVIKNYIQSKPPKGHASEYLHGAPVPPHISYQPEEDWLYSGPGLGSEYISGVISDRKSVVEPSFKPKFEDAQEIVQWGISHPFHGKAPPSSHHNAINSPSHSVNINPLINKSRSKPVYGPPPKQSYGIPSTSYGVPASGYGVPASAYGAPSNHRISASASQHHPQYVNAPVNVETNSLIKAQRQEALRIQKEQQIVKQQQSILNSQPFIADVQPLTPKPIDPFYSPILAKIDSLLSQIGVQDEPCKERLVCSMYQAPSKYSPHSNYLSAELSRESSELERPVQSNTAVVRFYKYVQAARDGQDQRDCISLYPCNLPVKK